MRLQKRRSLFRTDALHVAGWPLPRGRRLPTDRGDVFIREHPGPEGAPVVLLLHGLGATAGLQFFATMNQLGARFRVVAPDMRPVGARFRLDGAADDVAAVLEALCVEQACVVGYSIGGFITQRLLALHPDAVGGVVLVATVAEVPSYARRLPLSWVRRAAGALPGPWWGADLRSDDTPGSFLAWLAAELRMLDPATAIGALDEILRYESTLARDIGDRPTAVVITIRDRLVPARWQRDLLDVLPGAKAYQVNAGHAASGFARDRFGPVALDACTWVAAGRHRTR